VCVSFDWMDSQGDDCAAYATFPRWCGFEESDDKCCVCGGGKRESGALPVNIALLESSLTIDQTLAWPVQPLHGPPISSSRSWLKLHVFPSPTRCTGVLFFKNHAKDA